MLNEFGMTVEEEALFLKVAYVAERLGAVISDLSPLNPAMHSLLNALDELFESFSIIAPQVDFNKYIEGAK